MKLIQREYYMEKIISVIGTPDVNLPTLTDERHHV